MYKSPQRGQGSQRRALMCRCHRWLHVIKDWEVGEPSSINSGQKGGRSPSSEELPGSSRTNKGGWQPVHQTFGGHRLENAKPSAWKCWLSNVFVGRRVIFSGELLLSLSIGFCALPSGTRPVVKISAKGRLLWIFLCYEVLHATLD